MFQSLHHLHRCLQLAGAAQFQENELHVRAPVKRIENDESLHGDALSPLQLPDQIARLVIDRDVRAQLIDQPSALGSATNDCHDATSGEPCQLHGDAACCPPAPDTTTVSPGRGRATSNKPTCAAKPIRFRTPDNHSSGIPGCRRRTASASTMA